MHRWCKVRRKGTACGEFELSTVSQADDWKLELTRFLKISCTCIILYIHDALNRLCTVIRHMHVWYNLAGKQWLSGSNLLVYSADSAIVCWDKHHAWHRKVRHLPQLGPGQDVQRALVVELLLLWGCGHWRCWKSILWRRSCEHLLPQQVRDDWCGRPLLLQRPCLPMPHGPVCLASSRRISNLRLLQQKACGCWWMEWPAALWLVYQLWRYFLALLHLLHGSGLLRPTSQWPSSFCCADEGTVHQGWNQAGHAHGRRQAVLHGEHSPVLLGAVCYATSRGSSYVLLLQSAQQEGSLSKATCVRSMRGSLPLKATKLFESCALAQSQPSSTTILKMMWLVFPECADLPASRQWKGAGDAARLHCCSLWLLPLTKARGKMFECNDVLSHVKSELIVQ